VLGNYSIEGMVGGYEALYRFRLIQN
jgi:hypothetical protein